MKNMLIPSFIFLLTWLLRPQRLSRGRQGAHHVGIVSRDVFPQRGRKPPYHRESRADEPLSRQLRERTYISLACVGSVKRQLPLKTSLYYICAGGGGG